MLYMVSTPEACTLVRSHSDPIWKRSAQMPRQRQVTESEVRHWFQAEGLFDFSATPSRSFDACKSLKVRSSKWLKSPAWFVFQQPAKRQSYARRFLIIWLLQQAPIDWG